MSLLKHTAQGATAGLAATAVLQAVALPGERYLRKIHPPQTEDPASFMLWQVQKHLPRRAWLKTPAALETAAGFALSFGYGATFGALYGAWRKGKSNLLLDGTVLGIACWAVGYLGWLPATRLIPPPWKQTPAQFTGPIFEHIAYGIAAVATYELLNRKW